VPEPEPVPVPDLCSIATLGPAYYERTRSGTGSGSGSGTKFTGVAPTPAEARYRVAMRLLAIACAVSWLGCAGTEVAASTPLKPAPVAPAAATAEPAPRRVGSPYAYEWFVRAEILRAAAKLGPALDAYRAALSSSDEDPHVLARYATALDEAGQTERALEALTSGFEQDPYSESAWLARATIAERHGRLNDALEAYERAETAAPTSPSPPIALAALLDRHGNAERARAVLARYEARVLPGTSSAQRARLRGAMLRGDAQAAYVEARALGVLRVEDVPLVTQATALLLESDHCGLALDLLDLLGERPDAPLQLRALLACGRFGAAEELLRVTDPELLGGLMAIARAYLTIGRAAEALELALAHHTVHPEDAQGTLLLAEAQLASGQFADAAESFATSVRSGHSSEARDGLARTLAAAGLPELAREVREAALQP
jgi:tetratricopeptide (TPR) repeat protein